MTIGAGRGLQQRSPATAASHRLVRHRRDHRHALRRAAEIRGAVGDVWARPPAALGGDAGGAPRPGRAGAAPGDDRVAHHPGAIRGRRSDQLHPLRPRDAAFLSGARARAGLPRDHPRLPVADRRARHRGQLRVAARRHAGHLRDVSARRNCLLTVGRPCRGVRACHRAAGDHVER
jgi:hypothetical protein